MTSLSELVFNYLDSWLKDNHGSITNFNHPNYTFRIGGDTVYESFETVYEVEQWISRYEFND